MKKRKLVKKKKKKKKKNIEKVIMDISHTENIKNNKINLIQNLYKERCLFGKHLHF